MVRAMCIPSVVEGGSILTNLNKENMVKKHKVVILPTKKKSHIAYATDKDKFVISNAAYNNTDQGLRIPQHLYILSDEEVKEGDWYLSSDNIVLKPESFTYGGEEVTTERFLHVANKFGQGKIIATTDPKLVFTEYPEEGCNLPPIDIPISQIPQSFIESYAKNPVDEVELEYEVLGAIGHGHSKLKLVNNEVVVVNYVHQHVGRGVSGKLYTRDEVEKLCRDAYDTGYERGQFELMFDPRRCTQPLEQWIKENL